jgi:nicotinate-nucleotide adenylyltransferase
MRIAFFGGTFDPPHCGHLKIAQAATQRLHLDRVLFAPVGHQPLKLHGSSASFEDRMAMVKLAIAPFPAFEASELDAPLPGRRPNYTIDTLLRLKSSLHPHDDLFCLIGADSFLTLKDWQRAAELIFVCNFIVAARPGFTLDQMDRALPCNIQRQAILQQSKELIRFCLRNPQGKQTELNLLPDIHEEISATAIRAAIAAGQPTSPLLPQSVLAYIYKRGLYQS